MGQARGGVPLEPHPVRHQRHARAPGSDRRLRSGLKALGFRQVRVRYHETIARIEVGLDELPRVLEAGYAKSMVEAGKRHGFRYVTLDLAGYRKGRTTKCSSAARCASSEVDSGREPSMARPRLLASRRRSSASHLAALLFLLLGMTGCSIRRASNGTARVGSPATSCQHAFRS